MIIKGNTVGTPMPRTNYEQTDPAKADYLKGKGVLDQKILDAHTAADNAQTAADNAQSAANNAQTTADNALPKAGGTITGALNVPTPTEAAHAASKDYVEKYVASRHAYYEVVLAANGWVGEVAPFTQTIAVEGITETDRPHYGPVYSEDAETALLEKENWVVVDDLVTASGSVTFSCFEEKPAVDITVQMEVIR